LARRAASGKTANATEEALDDESFAGRQFITALARGLDVLGAFRVGDPPLSNQELAKRCNLPRPTISRITHTLTELGYLSYHEGFGCYELGGAMLTLGHVAKASFDALEEARPTMSALAEFSNANVGLGTRDRLAMLYLAVAKAPSGIGLRFETGSKAPMLQTAMGRAYLAGIASEDRDPLISRFLQRHADDAAMVEQVVNSAREEYARCGFCTSIGKWYEDVNGIAAPVPATPFADMLVLNCGAPQTLMPRDRMIDEVGPRLVETAAEIGKMFAAAEVAKAA
jgi:DNA-binding IclR family transcriptional regulator